MATMPGGGGGGGMLTGDPALQQAAAAAGALPGGSMFGAPQGPDYGPTASMWAQYFQGIPMSPTFATSDQLNQASGRLPFGNQPGQIGYGVLKADGGKKGHQLNKDGSSSVTPPFYASPEGQDARAAGSFEADRARLQSLADSILGYTASPGEVTELWTWALEQVDAAEKMGADPKDPWHWLGQRQSLAEEERTEEEGPRTVVQTQRTLNLTDPLTAEALIDQTLRNALGRAATEAEKAAFADTLRAKEEANPAITTTTTTTNADGTEIDSSTETTGGDINPSALAQQTVQEDHSEEAEAMLAASYLDVLRGI